MFVFSDKLTCRQVLHIMVFFGFMVNYMFRVNLTIAIVDMVVPINKSVDDHDGKPLSSECVAFVAPTNASVTKSLVSEDKVSLRIYILIAVYLVTPRTDYISRNASGLPVTVHCRLETP